MQLSHTETEAINRLKQVADHGLFSQVIRRKVGSENPQEKKELLETLLNQWFDNPTYMDGVLGFNLPKILKLKIYTLEEFNQQLHQLGAAYRVLDVTTRTDKRSTWIAAADYFVLPDGAGTVYVDSLLNRYVKLSNGQLFICTNADLLGLPEIEKKNKLAYLTGLID
jgi:hypothetical protein